MYARHPTPYGKGVAGYIQSRRVARVLAYAGIEPRDAVLEIGCESGNLCAALPPCARIVGSDISAEALRHARRLLQSRGSVAEFVEVDALQPLPFRRGEFDVVICSEMLEHVTDPAAVISNIADICTPETRVVLTVPIERPKLVIKRWLQKLGILPLLFPGIEAGQSEWHLHAFSKRELLRLTNASFLCERSSSVCGCHIVGLFRLRV